MRGGGARFAALGDEAAGELLLGAVIEIAQQLRLPAVPGLRADGADVGDRQHQQQAQALDRLHLGGEIGDGLGIVDVALEGGLAHQQVVAHQPVDGLGLLGGEAEARAELLRHFGAQFRMVAAAALGDVVQHHREIEHAARQHLMHHAAGDRRLLGQLARLDAVQDADGEEGVLVDRVVVVHVVLHLRDDAAEIGDEAAEHAGLAQAAQAALGILRRGQHLQEQAVGLGIGAQVAIDEAQVLR